MGCYNREAIKEIVDNMTPDELNWLINVALDRLVHSSVRTNTGVLVDGRQYDPIWDMYYDEFEDEGHYGAAR